MTNKEAITRLKDIFKRHYVGAENMPVLTMCIEALEGRDEMQAICESLVGENDKLIEQSRWIPVKYHEATEQELEEYGYPFEVCYIFENLMPNDEQEILITTKHTSKRTGETTYDVFKDVCYLDDGFSLDSGYDWITDVVAWKPLPEPYKESEDTIG